MISLTITETPEILQIAKQNNADSQMVEKVIRALLLLEGLVESGYDFVFKGGTALMLLLNSTKRLSIDIDIIVEDLSGLEEALGSVVANKSFIRFEKIERKAISNIEKAHYKLFYNERYRKGNDDAEANILLDVLVEKHSYQKLEAIAIDSVFVKQEGDILDVKVPSTEDLLGDKLTAFAPNTTGIPYIKKEDDMGMEIIKQLYDIGSLFDEIISIENTTETFKKIAQIELKYRELDDKTYTDVLMDIHDTSLLLATRGKDGDGDFDSLQNGITRIRQFIFSESYNIDKAIVDSAKAAYVATLIKYDLVKVVKFKEASEIAEWNIEQPYFKKLNKLKKSNPEAFFYWYKVYELEQGKLQADNIN